MIESMATPVSGLHSVATALDLLDCFGTQEELGVSDLSRRLGVAKSTVHRLLTTLCSRGFAERNPETGRYRLGLHLYELGTLAIGRYGLRRAAMPLLYELQQRSGCTVHLAVADGADVIQLERLESGRCTPLFSTVARRQPVHSTACGKAIAAFDPSCATARMRAGFPELTPSTIRSAGEFERDLALTRRRGFALNHDETRAGLTSVGVPVRDRSGQAFAALSVVAPTAYAERHIDRHARLASLAAVKLAKTVAVDPTQPTRSGPKARSRSIGNDDRPGQAVGVPAAS
ncbi:IclR family transcriptional regulator [Mycobacterium sp. SM1]|uniref:IclR family transcriptional regulator n=1 Tax=Mycobacterium sp. SM1 TaxID=2816243 RepID=UPI001BCE7FD5|nr:IclR family transcriptional regulator [Mycobacterium sp. SM1]MBS4730365.1 IclR family transcriptional regulator [Mycobacterium sp. SM1]